MNKGKKMSSNTSTRTHTKSCFRWHGRFSAFNGGKKSRYSYCCYASFFFCFSSRFLFRPSHSQAHSSSHWTNCTRFLVVPLCACSPDKCISITSASPLQCWPIRHTRNEVTAALFALRTKSKLGCCCCCCVGARQELRPILNACMYERRTTLEMLNDDGVFCKWFRVNIGTLDTQTSEKEKNERCESSINRMRWNEMEQHWREKGKLSS